MVKFGVVNWVIISEAGIVLGLFFRCSDESRKIMEPIDSLRSCKKYVTPKIGVFDPPFPHVRLCHLLIRTPSPHVTHQKVANSDGKN